jgi:hypothetical protein
MATVPQKRMNILGHLVTKHVRVDTKQKASAKPLPPPVAAVPEEPQYEGELADIHASLRKHLPAEEAEAYTNLVERRGPANVTLLANAFAANDSEEDFELIHSMLKDFGHNPRFMQLVLDDPKFVMALAEPLRTDKTYPSEMKYTRALSAVEEAFTPAFRNRANEVPAGADCTKYGPVFRASVVTKMLHLNTSAPTTFDEYEQMQKVRDNMETIMKHINVCKKSSDIMDRHGMMPTADDMLELCDIMDEFPNSGDAITTYLEERKRFHADELYSIVSLASPALMEGVL